MADKTQEEALTPMIMDEFKKNDDLFLKLTNKGQLPIQCERHKEVQISIR